VVNKVGTFLIALAAERQNVPVYALCQTDKFQSLAYDNESPIELEEKDGSEVISEGVPKVSVRNIYFDVTPAELIRGIVTDRGILKTSEVLPIAKEMTDYKKVWLM
jgi:translation initiation factor 2B subunit (eIF-2B alpha/beta/delta family)